MSRSRWCSGTHPGPVRGVPALGEGNDELFGAPGEPAVANPN
jgi:hypothetical protein